MGTCWTTHWTIQRIVFLIFAVGALSVRFVFTTTTRKEPQEGYQARSGVSTQEIQRFGVVLSEQEVHSEDEDRTEGSK